MITQDIKVGERFDCKYRNKKTKKKVLRTNCEFVEVVGNDVLVKWHDAPTPNKFRRFHPILIDMNIGPVQVGEEWILPRFEGR